jgi:fructose-1,6-bisphosphatase-3
MSTSNPNPVPAFEQEQAILRPLALQYPNIDAAASALARLSAELTLPKGTIHVISDVHGEYAKLRHVINNASGTLRPLVERLFAGQLSSDQMKQFLTLIFYPRETLELVESTLPTLAERQAFARQALRNLFTLVRHLARRLSSENSLRSCSPTVPKWAQHTSMPSSKRCCGRERPRH